MTRAAPLAAVAAFLFAALASGLLLGQAAEPIEPQEHDEPAPPTAVPEEPVEPDEPDDEPEPVDVHIRHSYAFRGGETYEFDVPEGAKRIDLDMYFSGTSAQGRASITLYSPEGDAILQTKTSGSSSVMSDRVFRQSAENVHLAPGTWRVTFEGRTTFTGHFEAEERSG